MGFGEGVDFQHWALSSLEIKLPLPYIQMDSTLAKTSTEEVGQEPTFSNDAIYKTQEQRSQAVPARRHKCEAREQLIVGNATTLPHR